MDQILFSIQAEYNKKNQASCYVCHDRVVLETRSTNKFLRVYLNKNRVIPIRDIVRVEISSASRKVFAPRPNAIHFVVKDSYRTLDQMYRDTRFKAHQYIDEGVQQLLPQGSDDLMNKLLVAGKIKDFIDSEIQKRNKES
ncbi:MAG TPA: hypothetical protein GXZ86_05720 [Clostridiales bacterium]|jgi:hypothetical protein|nr:hypothetical protein [Clostridiales bacterium]